ncbi:MAG TPA: twin-arginine translocase subunit TatC [Gemmatimonadales bacterium]|nr:twin-arginine translocase subunit TatC [Gemmatimonadales bacterium]
MAEHPHNRAEMPFLDHLEELRWRILYSLLAVLVGTLVGWVLVEHVDVIGLLTRPIAPLIPGGKLRVTSPTEPFFITLKVAFVVGLVIASPVIGYQAWAFLAPALYPRERRLIVPALSAGALLFFAGAAAAYLWVLPRALAVLLSFQKGVFDPLITADRYFAFAAQLVVAFGVITELPLVVIILAALGLVTPEFLARNRRYAIALSAGAAALLAPPDAVSMLLMMVPLWVLYEVSIVCARVVVRRRARPPVGDGLGSGPGGAGTGAGAEAGTPMAGLVALLLLGGVSGLAAQGRLGADTTRRAAGDTTRRGPADSISAGRLDTATARRLGLPTGPSRQFPPSDAVMDSVLRLKGYRVTQYVADTIVVQGDSVISLRGEAFTDREGTKLEADSIHYLQSSCRLYAAGDPRLFDQGTILVGEAMRYDTCLRRGTVHNALTDFQQGGATWYLRGDLAVDSGSTRVYGANGEITSDDHPVPDYHFATGEMKWLNKNVMVARPAVLYVHDVPIMWLPFIFQDIRKGRRSGILIPRFGLNDLVRPTRNYLRHIANVGFYYVPNDYIDLLFSGDWFARRYTSFRSQMRYHWLDQFVQGSFAYTRLDQLDQSVHSTRIGWQHSQSFSSRTHFSASIDYATSGAVITTNTVNPYLATASLGSQLNFDRRFDWGTLNVGGSRQQDLSSNQVTQNFPRVSLTPSPVNVTPSITWSPGFSFNNQQSFHLAQAPFDLPNGGVDSLFADNRQTDLSFQTPLRIGPWNWSNSLTVSDHISNARQEYVVTDSTVTPVRRQHRLYYQTFSTQIDWQTGINLPSLLTGTWKLQPGVAIVNQTSAGPTAIKNQFTGGRFLQQGKRLQFSAGMSPTLFGFFPGFGPIERIRHSISPIISYQYAPGSTVDTAFARAIDPGGSSLTARGDPQQTISLGLSQNFEAKLKPAAGDTSKSSVRKIRLLSINTSGLAYNFEQAKQKDRTGWQTQTLDNAFASDLLPGFSLHVTHDLWDGTAGLKSARFAPFLTNIAASFSVTPATIRGIASLFGLGAKAAPPPAAPGAPGAPGAPRDTSGQISQFGQKTFTGPGGIPLGGAGAGFNLQVSYSGTRIRPHPSDTLATTVSYFNGTGGRQTLNLTLAFSPTPHWSATWASAYDFDTQQFGQHIIRLQRDLHRWHASFSFVKTPNGNFAFNFNVALLDQPDIKFDYEQQSLLR